MWHALSLDEKMCCEPLMLYKEGEMTYSLIMVKSNKEQKRSVYPVAPIAKAPMKIKPEIEGTKHTIRRTPVEALASAASLSRNDKGQFVKRAVVESETSVEPSACSKPVQYYPSNAPGTRLC